MKKHILGIFLLFLTIPIFAQYTVSGGSGTPLRVVNDETRNKIQVYLLNGLSGAEISYTSKTSEVHQWYKYEERASQAVAVPCQQIGNTSTITEVEDGYGYFVGSPSDMNTSYVWIIDYSLYVPKFYSLSIEEDEFKCENIHLLADVEAEPLKYYTYNGAPLTIERTWHLQYSKLVWDERTLTFDTDLSGEERTGIVYEIEIDAPLMDTDFTLSGDAFAEHFGLKQSISTPVYRAIAVEAHAEATVYKEEADNEIKTATGGSDLGGSAPIDIAFTAYANEPVAAFFVWKIIQYDEYGNATTLVRYPDKTIRYTFESSGTFEVKLEVGDAQSICADTTQMFKVTIGDSELDVPNVFSPGSSPGINDEFKVAYKSLVSFKCTIFNRWGNMLYQWTDPSKGWDGKVNGKYVPTGVYFYIIEAKGADGVPYKKKGDINILRSKNN